MKNRKQQLSPVQKLLESISTINTAYHLDDQGLALALETTRGNTPCLILFPHSMPCMLFWNENVYLPLNVYNMTKKSKKSLLLKLIEIR